MSPTTSATEGIPRIAEKICLLWGTADFEPFVNSLVMDSKDGARRGLPMELGSELLWLVDVNRWRRAYDLHDRFKVDINVTYNKLLKQDVSTPGDSGDQRMASGENLGRRFTDRKPAHRPRRRKEENTLFGIFFGVVTHRYFLEFIILILTLKIMWPLLKRMF